jgi:Flp pilus assembly protein CpaB
MTGAMVTRPLAEGEMVHLEWLVAEGSVVDGRAITIPVTPEHAVGGILRPGDRVDVLATFDAADSRARTLLLASAVEVTDVTTAGGFVADDATVTGVTVITAAQDAARLAFAIRSGEIDLVKVIGSPGAGVVSPVRGSDL